MLFPDTRAWIRNRDGEAGEARFPELFFDLVFVFSLIQVTVTLEEAASITALAGVALVILALWWVWIYTTWVTNLLDPDRVPVRAMLFVMMFLGLVMATAIPEAMAAEGPQPMVFALCYTAIQVGRSLFAWAAFRGHAPELERTFARITLWLVAASLMWVLGALAEPRLRLLFWGAALVIEYLGPLFGFRVPGLGRGAVEDWQIEAEHIAERCALFVIICLGETILTTGRNFAGLDLEGHVAPAVASLAVSFAATVAMWWIYFHSGQREASAAVETSPDTSGAVQSVFTYGHVPLVAGIVVSAAGEYFALEEGQLRGYGHGAAAILAGPALFLSGSLWVKRAASGRLERSHLAGLAALAVLAFCPPWLRNDLLQAAAALVLIAVAAAEHRAFVASR